MPDMARASEVLHCAMCGIEVDPYFEWVASKANIADVPSRPKIRQAVLSRVGARLVPLVFPTEDQWGKPASLLGGAAADRAARAPRDS